MIFVTVGTTSFDSLVKEVDELVRKKKINEQVIIQIGKGKYKPKNCEYFDFAASLDKYYKRARIVISHEGAGTLLELVNLHKKVIVVPNPGTVDNPDILKKLVEEGFVLECEIPAYVEGCLNKIAKIKLKKYKKPKCNIAKEIQKVVKTFS